jgi:hypothetical protein
LKSFLGTSKKPFSIFLHDWQYLKSLNSKVLECIIGKIEFRNGIDQAFLQEIRKSSKCPQFFLEKLDSSSWTWFILKIPALKQWVEIETTFSLFPDSDPNQSVMIWNFCQLFHLAFYFVKDFFQRAGKFLIGFYFFKLFLLVKHKVSSSILNFRILLKVAIVKNHWKRLFGMKRVNKKTIISIWIIFLYLFDQNMRYWLFSNEFRMEI